MNLKINNINKINMETIYYFINNKKLKMIINLLNKKYFRNNKNNNWIRSMKIINFCLNNFQNLLLNNI